MSLRVFNLNYSYTSKFSLQDINLCFQNTVTAIIGPNGAGKSTLIKCIANIYKYSGDIYYMSQKINHDNKGFYAKQVSYLPQSSRSDATITVFEAILMGLMNTLTLHVSLEQTAAVNSMLEVFELQPLARRRICELSGGQLQMVLLAQALIKEPKILFLDEPLNNLDIYRQLALLKLIAKLSKEKQMVTVIVMHDINLASRYAGNVVVMNQGKLYSQGSPSKVITVKMLKDIYQIESKVHYNIKGYPVIEFLDVAANF